MHIQRKHFNLDQSCLQGNQVLEAACMVEAKGAGLGLAQQYGFYGTVQGHQQEMSRGVHCTQNKQDFLGRQAVEVDQNVEEKL